MIALCLEGQGSFLPSFKWRPGAFGIICVVFFSELCGCSSPGRRLDNITVQRNSWGGVEIANVQVYADPNGETHVYGRVQRKLGVYFAQPSLVDLTALDCSGTPLTNITVAYTPCPLRQGRIGQSSEATFEARLVTQPELVHAIRASICSDKDGTAADKR